MAIQTAYVAAVAGTRAAMDTRKTLPGLRLAQKYTVRCGGVAPTTASACSTPYSSREKPHRRGWWHCPVLAQAAPRQAPCRICRDRGGNPDHLREGVGLRHGMVLLDNAFAHPARGQLRINAASPTPAILEISGGNPVSGLRALARNGVDCISIGTPCIRPSGHRLLHAFRPNHEHANRQHHHGGLRATGNRRVPSSTATPGPACPMSPHHPSAPHWKDKIRRLLKERTLVMVSRTTCTPTWDLAEETGGIVSDSLEMARFGARPCGPDLVVNGRALHGRNNKILSPEKTVLMPDLDATCSLDLGCPASEFSAFCDAQHLIAQWWFTPTPAPP